MSQWQYVIDDRLVDNYIFINGGLGHNIFPVIVVCSENLQGGRPSLDFVGIDSC